jgi:AcrR family transcriptional regulator
MGSAERRERERQAMQTAIFDATRAIVSQKGYEGLTMRAVADRIEYSVAALYKHFADREELIRALCEHDFYTFSRMLAEKRGREAGSDVIEQLRALGRDYAEFALEHPEQYRVIFMTPAPIEKLVSKELGSPESDAYALVLGAVQAAQAAGHFATYDPHLVAQLMWATVHGVVSIEIAHMAIKKRSIPFVPVKQRIEGALDMVLLGLDAKAKAPKPRRPTARRR